MLSNNKKQLPSNACSMMSSQDKMTQYTNFSPHSDLNSKIKQPRPSNKQNLKTITIISDLNSNCQLPKPGDRRNFQDLLQLQDLLY